MRRSASALLGLALAGLLVMPTAAGAAPSQPRGTTARYTYANDLGTRDYLLHVPRRYRSRPVPLLVYLHGCTQTAEIARVQTHLDDFADRKNFLVAFPEQASNENSGNCWNRFLPDSWERGGEEPSIIAGITREVMARFKVDPRRVYVAGVSAGGAMTAVMGATYPDLYAAISAHAGCEYRGAPCIATPVAPPPDVNGELAYGAMGAFERPVPLMAVVGDADQVAPPQNTDALVHQYLWTNDWADDGADNGSVSQVPARSQRFAPAGRRPYDVDYYVDAKGCALEEHWVIEGMNHAYSGGDPSTMYSDPTGPEVTGPMWAFLLAHPMPVPGKTVCPR
ncbi:MAG: PHB depolymerase family esterase [Actinomycetota bacterium]